MNNRELLELAARAIGCVVVGYFQGGIEVRDRLGEEYRWGPLENDGDALRLASDLLFVVSMDFGYTRVTDQNGRQTFVTSHGLAATRQAIVEAAANLGRTMP